MGSDVKATGRKFGVIDGGKSKAGKKVAEEEAAAVDRIVHTFDMSDTGNAERLAHKFGDRIHYVAAWDTHIVYADGHWKRDTAEVTTGRLAKLTVEDISDEAKFAESTEKTALAKWRKKSFASGRRHAMVDLLKHEEGIAIDHAMLDVDRWALNVRNGTLDLRTNALKPHDPADLMMKIIPIEYKPNARAPRWERFVKEVLPDAEVRAFVQRFLGYSLTGDVSERMFVIFLGGGRNGKTAMLNAVESVMGQYATTAAPTLLVAKDIESHPADIADLFGSRLAVTSETKKGATFDEERVKRLTGSDRLKARFMGENFWHFDPTHKLLIASNHKPRVKDATDSFWDRVAIVPFSVRIAKAKVDRKLAAKLREEREGILAWLVEGCRLWREKGLSPPAAVLAATTEYRTEEDLVARFLTDCCEFKKDAFMLTSELMKVNKVWADGLNLYPSSAKDLAEKLRGEPYNCVPTKRHGNMGWKGVHLTQKIKFK